MVCLPCAAALGPPGVAVAAVGSVGYGVYKYTSPNKINKKKKKKKNKKKKLTKKKGGSNFKKGEPLLYQGKNGKTLNAKFHRNISKNKISIRLLNKKFKPTITVNVDKVIKKKINKNLANTKARQKTKRAKIVRKKRGIKTLSETESLPESSDDVGDLMNDMKL